ncbi:CBY1-interacting BAR domain-containing protein 1 [Corythoichthys intestinalis]|uniref:CBY1-interacting BAR domain-containing protein 1 n=1 Tax=Corythoichthys intestinalis TaxID=161448 RepID=UPI0025A60068|nr:CBY1-interacting BAR domain-containing protein 1 [Corythoichthys intestinalis]XP_061809009.1 CBY1-interacting BAR domain-containing protein 1-like [Nerophis lumbriciformis]
MIRTPDARTRDNQTKRIRENISNVKKHFGELCAMFAAYGRKTAKLRDEADALVREIADYADTETPGLKKSVKCYAEHLAKIQDYRQAQVERLEAKVIEPLKGYGALVRRKREDVKVACGARKHESRKMEQLERTRQRNPGDRQVISQAESELQRATVDAARTTRQLEETIDDFEKQKIQDIKRILCDFACVEMTFHAKALELYTLAYQSMDGVDEEDDLEVFRSSLRPPDYPPRANSRASLDGTASSFLTSTVALQRALGRPAGEEGESEEEEEEEEDEEEEEEEEESEEETR